MNDQNIIDLLSDFASAPPRPIAIELSVHQGRRRRRQRRVAFSALGVAVLLVVGAGVSAGVTAAASHHVDRIRTAAPPYSATPPFPGYVVVSEVRVPSNLTILTARAVDGQVWAVSYGSQPILLRSAAGGTLQEVRRFARGTTVALFARGDNVLITSGKADDLGSAAAGTDLTVYDGRSGTILSTTDLNSRYGATSVDVVAADAGLVPVGTEGGDGPLSIVLTSKGQGGNQLVRSGLVAADGSLSDLTPAVPIVYPTPFRSSFVYEVLVTSQGGRPRYAFSSLVGDAHYVERLDLLTGAVAEVEVDPGGPENGVEAAAVGVLADGQVLYESAFGYSEGPAASNRPKLVAGSNRIPRVLLVAGIAYVVHSPAAGLQTVQALDPRTLKPRGGVVSTLGADVLGGDGVAFIQRPATTDGEGGTLTAYAPG